METISELLWPSKKTRTLWFQTGEWMNSISKYLSAQKISVLDKIEITFRSDRQSELFLVFFLFILNIFRKAIQFRNSNICIKDDKEVKNYWFWENVVYGQPLITSDICETYYILEYQLTISYSNVFTKVQTRFLYCSKTNLESLGSKSGDR